MKQPTLQLIDGNGQDQQLKKAMFHSNPGKSNSDSSKSFESSKQSESNNDFIYGRDGSIENVDLSRLDDLHSGGGSS